MKSRNRKPADAEEYPKPMNKPINDFLLPGVVANRIFDFQTKYPKAVFTYHSSH